MKVGNSSSKYDFSNADIDKDVQRKQLKIEARRSAIRHGVFSMMKQHGIDATEKEILDLFRNWKTGQVVLTPTGFEETAK